MKFIFKKISNFMSSNVVQGVGSLILLFISITFAIYSYALSEKLKRLANQSSELVSTSSMYKKINQDSRIGKYNKISFNDEGVSEFFQNPVQLSTSDLPIETSPIYSPIPNIITSQRSDVIKSNLALNPSVKDKIILELSTIKISVSPEQLKNGGYVKFFIDYDSVQKEIRFGMPFTVVNNKLIFNWAFRDLYGNIILKIVNNTVFVPHYDHSKPFIPDFKFVNLIDRLEIRDKYDNIVFSVLISNNNHIILQGYFLNMSQKNILTIGRKNILELLSKYQNNVDYGRDYCGVIPLFDFRKLLPVK